MKTAILFEIKRHNVTLLRGRSYIERYRHDGTLRQLDTGSAIASVQLEQLPVERISKIECGAQKDHYIALDPELREILETPFTSTISALEFRCRRAESDAEGWHDKCYELNSRITSFNNLPWYRRIFVKV